VEDTLINFNKTSFYLVFPFILCSLTLFLPEIGTAKPKIDPEIYREM